MTGGAFAAILDRLEQAPGVRSTPLFEFFGRILEIQAKAEQRFPEPPPGAVKRQAGGTPLLAFDDLEVDWDAAREVLREIAGVFSTKAAEFGEIPPLLIEERSVFRKAARAWYEGSGLPPEIALAGGTHLIETIIQLTMQPFLVRHAVAYRQLVDQDGWRRGSCPVCGGLPDLAYLDGEAGARHLMCSRCDTTWLFQRLECPYCGNTDQETLSFLTDDAGLYRLYLCDRCHRYLKALDRRRLQGDVFLPYERISTLPLDTQAQDQGYLGAADVAGCSSDAATVKN